MKLAYLNIKLKIVSMIAKKATWVSFSKRAAWIRKIQLQRMGLTHEA